MGAPPFFAALDGKMTSEKLEKLHKSHTFDMVIP